MPGCLCLGNIESILIQMLAGFGKEQHHMGLGRFGDLVWLTGIFSDYPSLVNLVMSPMDVYIGCVSKLRPPNRWVSYTNQLFPVRFKETTILTHSAWFWSILEVLSFKPEFLTTCFLGQL